MHGVMRALIARWVALIAMLRFARARYSYQSRAVRALRLMAHPANELPACRSQGARRGTSRPSLRACNPNLKGSHRPAELPRHADPCACRRCALRDDVLPLFAAADDRAGILRPEATEPTVQLPAMTAGREVVEDYRSTGLSLRARIISRSCARACRRGYVPCQSIRSARNGSRISIAGLLLVRQMPVSAKGVMFITLEDESANANLIVWPSVFERNRRTILSASMMGCRGKVQHESGVIHLIVEEVSDLSSELKRISGTRHGVPVSTRTRRRSKAWWSWTRQPRSDAHYTSAR